MDNRLFNHTTGACHVGLNREQQFCPYNDMAILAISLGSPKAKPKPAVFCEKLIFQTYSIYLHCIAIRKRNRYLPTCSPSLNLFNLTEIGSQILRSQHVMQLVVFYRPLRLYSPVCCVTVTDTGHHIHHRENYKSSKNVTSSNKIPNKRTFFPFSC